MRTVDVDFNVVWAGWARAKLELCVLCGICCDDDGESLQSTLSVNKANNGR